MSTQRTPRRIELEAVARRLFAARGYHATSMEDLAQALGMRRGSLYTHISAKEELLLATVERGADAFQSALAEALEGAPPSAPTRLSRALRAHLGVVAAEPDAAACFLWEWRHLGEPDRSRAIELRDGYERRVRELFADGVAEGAFRADLDVTFASMSFLSMGNWAATWYRPDGPLSPDEVADRFYSVLLAGVAAPSS